MGVVFDFRKATETEPVKTVTVIPVLLKRFRKEEALDFLSFRCTILKFFKLLKPEMEWG